ncbi:hypothetical protein ACRRTK_012620 [Alexandromys fortis]
MMKWFTLNKVPAYELLCIYSSLVLHEDKVRVTRTGSMPSSEQLASVLNRSGLACLQRPWPVSTLGTSSAIYRLVGLLQQLESRQQEVLPPLPLLPQ